MAKIMRRELVWDIFCATDGSKIGIFKGNISDFDSDKNLLKKMYSIVSLYYNYSYNDFCDSIDDFIAFVGKEADFGFTADYNSIKELYKALLEEEDYLFYIVYHNKWNMVEVEADYFSIQGTDDYDRPFTKATYQDYDSAVKYCRENDVDINNIVLQKWGTYVSLFD